MASVWQKLPLGQHTHLAAGDFDATRRTKRLRRNLPDDSRLPLRHARNAGADQATMDPGFSMSRVSVCRNRAANAPSMIRWSAESV